MTELGNPTSEVSAVAEEQDDDPQDSRRHLLRLAAAAVAGGAVAGFLNPAEAAADSGDFMVLGASNIAGTDQTSLSSSNEFAFSVISSHIEGTTVTASGVKSSTALNASVTPSEAGAVAVRAEIQSGGAGFPLKASGGEAQMVFERYLSEGFVTKPSPSGGQFFANLTGLYYCVQNGPGGPEVCWWTLASRDSAGAFYPISPTRVYDSRTVAPMAPLGTGENRTFFVGDGIAPATADVVPPGARAIAYNLTVTGTVGGFGFMAVNEGGNASAATSTINWTAADQTLANASVVKLNETRKITVVCGGPDASTHFIIDVLGYYH